MSGVFELATSGRAKCRGCGATIARGELRFGEKLPSSYGEGEMLLWFHPMCAAHKRPEPLLEALSAATEPVAGRDGLERAAQHALTHRRVSRIDGAERAPTGQAKCRHCHAPIAKGAWRIRVVFYEEGRFEPGGFIHVACRGDYFETADVNDAVLHFSAKLPPDDRAELQRALVE